MRKHTALAASIAAMAGLAVGITGTLAANHEPTPRTVSGPTVNECSHEDDIACVWHAAKHGNGEGRDFYVDAQGTTYYATDTFCLDAATRVLDMSDIMLTAWENGTAYSDSFRVDNVDVYAEQLTANCQD